MPNGKGRNHEEGHGLSEGSHQGSSLGRQQRIPFSPVDGLVARLARHGHSQVRRLRIVSLRQKSRTWR